MGMAKEEDRFSINNVENDKRGLFYSSFLGGFDVSTYTYFVHVW